MKAECLLRDQPQYRANAFRDGLVAAGYSLVKENRDPVKGDILVIWNRYGRFNSRACAYERRGATVLVAENGYLGRDYNGEHWYAIGVGRHNGNGNRQRVAVARSSSIASSFCPGWKQGEAVLFLEQRGIGIAPAAQPKGWLEGAIRKLRTDRDVIVRKHPGEKGNHSSLYDDLKQAWCVVTWGSGAAIKAIHAGVPAFYECPDWIGQAAAKQYTGDIEEPYLGDRSEYLRCVHAGMFRLDEIKTGLPFRCLA